MKSSCCQEEKQTIFSSSPLNFRLQLLCISSFSPSSFFLLPWILSPPPTPPHFRSSRSSVQQEQRSKTVPLGALFEPSFLQLFGGASAPLLLFFAALLLCFCKSDCSEVHANAAETLCAITRYAPPGLASKIASPSFIGRLFHHALERSRPKSVLISLLSVCISLLDPKRLDSGMYYMYIHQMTHGSGISADPATVEGMLENLGDLLKLLDVSSEDDHVLLTMYDKLQPPLGKHRLKIIEFISVLVAVSSEVAEKEFIRLGAVKHVFEMFFEYPYNNFLHHYVARIVVSCLESKIARFVEHILRDCNVIGKILEAETCVFKLTNYSG
ncbi:uncharacterized protein [Primulina huaijiensis]|uniref:uncharacterized protein n=1 Tax=Primulina huaijiensis TaxID=1492673 RepID=UPI003CC71C01